MSSVFPNPDSNPTPELIEAAAAAWLSLRDRGLTAAETAEFMHWLQEDAQHTAVFAELESVWKDFDRLSAVPAATTPPLSVDADLLAPRTRTRRHRTLAWASVAFAAAAAVAFVFVSQTRTLAHTAETAVGAFQKFDLPDGSVAQLNTDSAIDTDFTPQERRVRVVRGEVFFNVTKDHARPFIVTSGPVSVRAVGTAFNVRKNAASVEILVTEGRVQVADASQGQSLVPSVASPAEPPLLVAGERVLVAAPARKSGTAPTTSKVEKISAAEVQRALAWQERRLEFDATPLAAVVAEFNRYNQRQLVIADAKISAKRFSGSFRADSYEPLVRLLEADFGLSATWSERSIVLRAKR
jgi:transmembrane sensor